MLGPVVLSQDAMRDLGMLVICIIFLSGERFGQYANHLSPTDRQAPGRFLKTNGASSSTG